MPTKRVLLLTAAIEREIYPTIQRLSLRRSGPYYKRDIRATRVVAGITGIGRERAHRAIREAAEFHRPDHILSVGFAAGLDPALRAGQACHATTVTTPAAETIDLTARSWLPTDANGFLNRIPIQRGALLTIDQAVCTPNHKHDLFHKHRCLIADMEGYAVAELANKMGIGLDILKAISDPADMTLPKNIDRWVTDDGCPNPWAVARGLLIRPRDLPRVLKLGRHAAASADNIAQVVQAVIEQG